MADPTERVYAVISISPVWGSIRPCHSWQEDCCALGRWSESVLQVCVVKFNPHFWGVKRLASECDRSIYRRGLKELSRTGQRRYSGDQRWNPNCFIDKRESRRDNTRAKWCRVTLWVCYNNEVMTTHCILVLELPHDNLKQISFPYNSATPHYCVIGNRKQMNLTILISFEKPISNSLWFGGVAWAQCPISVILLLFGVPQHA